MNLSRSHPRCDYARNVSLLQLGLRCGCGLALTLRNQDDTMLQTLLLAAALIGFIWLTMTAPSVRQAIAFSLGAWVAIVGLGILYLRNLQ